METSKLNLGLSISRNFNKVTIEMMDEPIEYDSSEMLQAKIRKKMKLIKEEIELQFSLINKK
jgi:hypothetical protein